MGGEIAKKFAQIDSVSLRDAHERLRTTAPSAIVHDNFLTLLSFEQHRLQ